MPFDNKAGVWHSFEEESWISILGSDYDTIGSPHFHFSLLWQVLKKFPHLAGYHCLRLPVGSDAKKLVKSQLALAAIDGKLIVPLTNRGLSDSVVFYTLTLAKICKACYLYSSD